MKGKHAKFEVRQWPLFGVQSEDGRWLKLALCAETILSMFYYWYYTQNWHNSGKKNMIYNFNACGYKFVCYVYFYEDLME